MKFTITIVATVDAECYTEAIEVAEYRLEENMRQNGAYVNKLRPARIDVQLKPLIMQGESE